MPGGSLDGSFIRMNVCEERWYNNLGPKELKHNQGAGNLEKFVAHPVAIS